MIREICEEPYIYAYSTNTCYQGSGDYCNNIQEFQGFDLIQRFRGLPHNGTPTGWAVQKVMDEVANLDRIIVLTDEQSRDRLPLPEGQGYIINVASYQNGIRYGSWNHINGWSENILGYIQAAVDEDAGESIFGSPAREIIFEDGDLTSE